MNTSDNGIAIIKEFEGFEPQVYKDIVGIPTIGYGHVVQPGEVFGILTEENATALLKTDLVPREQSVNDLVKVTINQNQFDALVSFVYNLGSNALKNSTLLRKLNGGDFAGAADQFLSWCMAGGKPVAGLKKRRGLERDLFLKE